MTQKKIYIYRALPRLSDQKINRLKLSPSRSNLNFHHSESVISYRVVLFKNSQHRRFVPATNRDLSKQPARRSLPARTE